MSGSGGLSSRESSRSTASLNSRGWRTGQTPTCRPPFQPAPPPILRPYARRTCEKTRAAAVRMGEAENPRPTAGPAFCASKRRISDARLMPLPKSFHGMDPLPLPGWKLATGNGLAIHARTGNPIVRGRGATLEIAREAQTKGGWGYAPRLELTRLGLRAPTSPPAAAARDGFVTVSGKPDIP